MNAIIATAALSEKQASEFCREQGIYMHHVEQWKQDFIQPNQSHSKKTSKGDRKDNTKLLKHENQKLKKELNRKDKALAETAALLVLQKKVTEIWGCDEDS